MDIKHLCKAEKRALNLLEVSPITHKAQIPKELCPECKSHNFYEILDEIGGKYCKDCEHTWERGHY